MVYLFSFLISLIKGLSFFTGSYSNTVFLDPLSKEEEEKYINLLEQKDKDARNKLIEHNLRLVAHIVKKFDQGSADQDDLISIGTIGLIKGVDSYNKDKNIKLTTYVAKCIENEILMFPFFQSFNVNNRVICSFTITLNNFTVKTKLDKNITS